MSFSQILTSVPLVPTVVLRIVTTMEIAVVSLVAVTVGTRWTPTGTPAMVIMCDKSFQYFDHWLT